MSEIYKKNLSDLKQIKKKYAGLLAHFFHPKKTKKVKEKIERVPNRFLHVFDQKSYLLANPDVHQAVKENKMQSGLEHFVLFGYEEVQRGDRKIGEAHPLMSEEEYFFGNDDIQEAVESGEFSSAFEHLLLFGYQEILKGNRRIEKTNRYRYRVPKFTSETSKEILSFSHQPLISIVMPVYNVDVKWLELAIASVEAQWYKHWELCIADDASTNMETRAFLQGLNHSKIQTVFLDRNVNISGASNAALALAEGEYVALMDNDDELTPDALYEVVKAINENEAVFIYSDEDKIEPDGSCSDPHFKADYAPDMLLSQNYISHLCVIEKRLIDEVGGWQVGLEGSQDYDLYLKVLEKTDRVSHIPKVLYHWRKVPGSTASEFSSKSFAQKAGREALQNALKRREVKGSVEDGKYPGTYRVSYGIEDTPLVSIVIPFKDKPELLDLCIGSILEKSTYDNFEIIGISNNSQKQATFEAMKTWAKRDERIRFYEYNTPFNYSEINNHAVRQYAKGEHIVLLNNDIEIISPDWIEALLAFSQQSHIGAVGAKLYYPDNTIQHAGVVLGIGGVAGHSHKYFSQDEPGYFARPHIIQNVSAVTAACLMVKKELYESVDGLNENDLKIAFNDVDFCLRLRETGYINIYTPYCEAYHHESKSRGAEDTPEKIARFKHERNFMLNRHADILKQGDPYYNVNLTLLHENFGLKRTYNTNMKEKVK